MFLMILWINSGYFPKHPQPAGLYNEDEVFEVKAIPVTGHGGPQGCETSRLPRFFFLDSRLTDGGEVISLTCQLPFTPRKIPGTHFS
jgi:hypothetical protein